MFNDLFTAIAAGVIGVLPVQPAPAVVVTTDSVKASVVQYIDAYEHRSVTIDCEFETKELSVKENESLKFVCLTTDKENKEQFNTNITVTAKDKKVSITAVLDAVDKRDTSTTPEKK